MHRWHKWADGGILKRGGKCCRRGESSAVIYGQVRRRITNGPGKKREGKIDLRKSNRHQPPPAASVTRADEVSRYNVRRLCGARPPRDWNPRKTAGKSRSISEPPCGRRRFAGSRTSCGQCGSKIWSRCQRNRACSSVSDETFIGGGIRRRLKTHGARENVGIINNERGKGVM